MSPGESGTPVVTTQSSPRTRPRIFYGWWIVAAGMVMGTMGHMFFAYGFSAFFIPWRAAFGWSRTSLSGVLSMARLEGGLFAPVAGWAFDKFGPRRMMLIGVPMMGLGFLALSRVTSLPMLAIVFVGFLGIGSSLGTVGPVQVALANWFILRRGRVMGLITTGMGVGGSLVFVFAFAIQRLGWQEAAILAGVTFLVVGIPLALVVRHKPEEMGLLPDGATAPPEAPPAASLTSLRHGATQNGASTPPEASKPRQFWMRDPGPEIDLTPWQALRAPAFWLIALTFACWGGMAGSLTVHLPAFLAEELKVEYVAAVAGLSLLAGVSIIGRLGFGFLSEYVNIRLLMASLLVAQAGGLFLMSRAQSLPEVLFYIVLLAVPYGGMLPMNAIVRGHFFGRKRFGTIGGLIGLVNLPASVAAPIWVGFLADTVPGGYRVALRIMAVLVLIAAFAILWARRPRPPLPADEPPLLVQLFRRRGP